MKESSAQLRKDSGQFYKVFARRWDGSLLQPTMLGSASGASKFDEATTLTLSADEIIEGVAFSLPKAVRSHIHASGF